MKDATIGTEYLPNVSIEKIDFQQFDTNNKVIISICMYDHFARTWSANEKFTRYLQASCFIVSNRDIINKINNGEETLENIPEGPTVFNTHRLTEQFDAFTEFIVNKRGKKYRKFKKTFKFNLGRRKHVSCYGISAINVKDLKDNEGLDLSYAKKLNYMGSLESEKILDDGEVVLKSNLFKDVETLEPWGGPVHEHEEVVMAGSQHSSSPHRLLREEEVENIKINVFQMETGEVPPNNLNRPVLPGNRRRNRRFSAYFQMEPFEDANRNLKNIVVLDMHSLFLQESRLAQLINEADPETSRRVSEMANINSIEVKRTREGEETFLDAFGRRNSLTRSNTTTTIAKSNNNHTKVKRKILYQTSANKKFSVDPKLVRKINKNQIFDGKIISESLLKNSRKIGRVEQLNTSLPNNFRSISVIDYDISSALEGKYKYSLDLSFKDVYYDFCHNFLNQLNKHLHKLDGLYNSLVLKNVYKNDSFDENFLVEFYSQYNIEVNGDGMVVGEFLTESLKNSFLVKSIQDLFKAEMFLMRRRSLHYRNALNMFSTDMDKISSLIEHYRKIINLFKIKYDLQDSQGYEKSSSKSRKDRGYIKKTITLSKTYERKRSIPIGVNFISTLGPNDEIPKVNTLQFKARADLEFNKFFNSSVITADEVTDNIPASVRSKFINLHQDKFKMFTPSRIYFGNQEIDTTQINPKSFDSDFFNSIRVVQSVLNSTETNLDHEDLAPDNSEDLEQYLDSRDFLGDETNFNTTILRLIKLAPSKILNVRKKFRLLDNKILTAKNSNFSLKTFDLSNETSPLANILQNNLGEIPIQIKALSLLKSPLTKFNLNTINFDPLSNPQTQEVFSQNYLNIGKVEVLEGFRMNNGRYIMKNPIFKEIEFNDIDKYENKNLLCHIVDTNFQGLGADRTGMMIYDRVFLMENSQEDNPESPINENTQVMQMSNTTSTQETDTTEMEVNTDTNYTSDLEGGVMLTDSSGQPIFTSDISNTTVVQNESNNDVISVIPLIRDETAVMVSTTVINTPPEAAPTSVPVQVAPTIQTGGSSY